MPIAADALPARLAGEPLRPAYLVAGGEPLLLLEAADAIRAAAREQGCCERETFEADARGFDWNGFAAQVNAPSLFSPRRLLELHLPTGKPGKEGAELIAGFCTNPPADVTLLVLAGAWSRQHGGKYMRAGKRVTADGDAGQRHLDIEQRGAPHRGADADQNQIDGEGR